MFESDSALRNTKFILLGILVILLVILTGQIIMEVRISSKDVLVQSLLRQIAGHLDDFNAQHGFYPDNPADVMIEEYPYRLDYLLSTTRHGYTLRYEPGDHEYIIRAVPNSEDKKTLFINSDGQLFAEY